VVYSTVLCLAGDYKAGRGERGATNEAITLKEKQSANRYDKARKIFWSFRHLLDIT